MILWEKHKTTNYNRADKYEGFRKVQGRWKIIGRGDIIGFTWVSTRTKRGELSLIPLEIKLLSPC